MENYKMKSRGMNNMKNNKIVLIVITLLLIVALAACGNNNAKTIKKIPLTSQNVQKVFNNQYNVEHINLDSNNVTATFVSKNKVSRKDAANLIKDIQAKINENFTITNSNDITLDNNDYTQIGVTDNNNKITIGAEPSIYIKTKEYTHNYSMSSKFNLLKPAGDVTITAKDSEDGNLTSKIKLKNDDVLTKLGSQTLTYTVTDSDGNTTTSNLDLEITK